MRDSRSLITFLLLAYNQERFIREAVAGALAQIYSPLQVILSDDASKDRTFEIMQEMTATYSGPHRVVLNRNPRNFGLAAHINRGMELAQGELIVAAAGDDRSDPKRTETLFAAWNAAGRPKAVIYSDVMQMDEDGNPLHAITRDPGKPIGIWEVLHGQATPVIGCSECWHRQLFDFFGPLGNDVVNEDGAIWFRAELLGRIIHVPKVLVHHRLHGSNTGACGLLARLEARQWLEANAESMRRQGTVVRQNLADLKQFQTRGGQRPDLDVIECSLERWLNFSRAGRDLCLANGAARWQPALRYLRHLPAPTRLTLLYLRLLTKLLWPGLHLRLHSALRRNGDAPPQSAT